MDGAIAAATSGHDAIVSPTSHAYFDYPIETLDLRQVYSFEPIPPGLTDDQEKHILGGECNMWTEYAPQETIDSKMFPRMLAMSEALWSPREGKDYRKFHSRVRHHYKRLDLLGVQYGPESRPISMLPAYDASNNEFEISLESGEPDLAIHYTMDSSDPTIHSRRYEKSFLLKETSLVKAAAFHDGEQYGEISEKQFYIHLASGKPARLKFEYSSQYKGGGRLGLTDGITGSTNFRDGFWQGFEYDDMEAVIDLGKSMPIRKVIVSFIQQAGAWIFFPKFVEYAISDDGENFREMTTVHNDFPTDYQDPIIKKFQAKFETADGRYVKVFAKNIAVCPPEHPSAGGKAWVFVDEIVVR
jgi:hexosaminidase